MQLYPNYTQKHVITYTNSFITVASYPGSREEEEPVTLRLRMRQSDEREERLTE